MAPVQDHLQNKLGSRIDIGAAVYRGPLPARRERLLVIARQDLVLGSQNISQKWLVGKPVSEACAGDFTGFLSCLHCGTIPRVLRLH